MRGSQPVGYPLCSSRLRDTRALMFSCLFHMRDQGGHSLRGAFWDKIWAKHCPTKGRSFLGVSTLSTECTRAPVCPESVFVVAAPAVAPPLTNTPSRAEPWADEAMSSPLDCQESQDKCPRHFRSAQDQRPSTVEKCRRLAPEWALAFRLSARATFARPTSTRSTPAMSARSRVGKVRADNI